MHALTQQQNLPTYSDPHHLNGISERHGDVFLEFDPKPQGRILTRNCLILKRFIVEKSRRIRRRRGQIKIFHDSLITWARHHNPTVFQNVGLFT